MFIRRCQNAGQNHTMKIPNKSFEIVAKFRHSGTTEINNQNYIKEELKSKINSENICYQNILSSHLLLKNLKIKIYKNIILPDIWYSSFTLRKEHRYLRIFGSKRREVTEGRRKLHNKVGLCRNLFSSPNILLRR
jgi:hypothetical protein